MLPGGSLLFVRRPQGSLHPLDLLMQQADLILQLDDGHLITRAHLLNVGGYFCRGSLNTAADLLDIVASRDFVQMLQLPLHAHFQVRTALIERTCKCFHGRGGPRHFPAEPLQVVTEPALKILYLSIECRLLPVKMLRAAGAPPLL